MANLKSYTLDVVGDATIHCDNCNELLAASEG